MQPVYAQETLDGSIAAEIEHATSPAGAAEEHGTPMQSHDTPADEVHGDTDGHAAGAQDVAGGHTGPGTEGAANSEDALQTNNHAAEAHDGEHHEAAAHAEGGHSETGHHAGYHPPSPYLLNVGPTTVHLNTLIATWIVMAILITLGVMASRKLTQKPDKKQVFFESLVDIPHSIVKSQISHDTYKYVPLIGTIFLFILVSNWSGLLPWRILELFGTPLGFEIAAPTNDLNTNGAIAFVAVAAYWFYGIQKKGLAHFKHYVSPMWVLFPLNVMEDISRPLSLSFRLFGNILGGEIVIGILLFLTAPLVVTSLVALPMFTMEVLVGFIQAFIFSMLTASYIGAMVADHH
ncbi:MAG: F0F1 ATP synthase subunit A [Candidatus Sericytochromatia bacterium]